MTEQMAFQAKLRSQLFEAQQKNSAFSLRAFASKLQMSPSALSEILNGKRRVSQQLAEKTLILMGTEPSELAKILRLFEKRDLSISEDKANGSYLELKSDQFQLIAQWYHFAILSLAETKGFKATPLWIAKRLGIKVIEAEQALERLNRLGFIQWSRSQKKLKLMQGQLTTSDDVADAAVRKSHFEDLKLAEETLAKVPVAERDFSSITIAINKNKLSLAKKMIRQFQDQLSAVLEADTKDEVFKFSFYAIPLSKPINET